ncbi:hypothetical protein M2146_001652 [Lachnospiraceae bacterium PF1-22]|uniref:YcxB family protein n=1 Tax=Ohessyouella blattaphilus TaxID=2949333 RepID=UPI003E2FE493
MTVLYEVHTGHTKSVLKGFAKLLAKNTGRRLMFRFSILALILFTLPRALNAPTYGYVICWAFGIFVILIALGRPYLTYWNLLARDTYYRNNTPITITFGHSQFVVDDGNTDTYKYFSIEELYADNDLFYLYVGNGDIFVFEKTSFTTGTADDFYPFMQLSTGKEFKPVNPSIKQRIFNLRQDMKKAELDHDAKVASRKKKKK